jgi:asparagine synthetase B (glutamine-hydrolysing)
LTGDHVADSAQEGEGDGADERNGGETGHTQFLKTTDGGRKKEGEGKGEDERDEELAREVENEHDDSEQKKRLTPGKFG